MKTSIQTVAAAVALAVSGTAQADITVPGFGGELMLNVWDVMTVGPDGTVTRSYTRGLDVDIEDLGSLGVGSVLEGGDDIFQDLFSGVTDGTGVASDPANIMWNIVAYNGNPNPPETRTLSSAPKGADPVPTNSQVVQAGNNAVVRQIEAVNTEINGGFQVTNGDDILALTDDTTNAFATNDFGGNLDFEVNFSNVGTINDTLELWVFTQRQTGLDFFGDPQFTSAATADVFFGPLEVALSADGGVQVVPLPAAVWFLGAGLAGLLALGRRRQAA